MKLEKALVYGAGIISFVLCLAAGLHLITHSDLDSAFAVSVSLYFVGKAFFVGPMLWIAASKMKD